MAVSCAAAVKAASSSEKPSCLECKVYGVTSLIKNSPPPWGHHIALEIVLLYGPRRGLFLVSEVPL